MFYRSLETTPGFGNHSHDVLSMIRSRLGANLLPMAVDPRNRRLPEVIILDV
jgi:hypothetical protein